jgi:small GTP-binding protein
MAQDGTIMDAKVVLLGSANVGKTSIISRAVSDEFDQQMPATIGACYTAKEVDIANVTVNLQIWDTAGQERFRTLAPMYYRGSVVALLVYAINDEASLQDVRKWVDEIR